MLWGRWCAIYIFSLQTRKLSLGESKWLAQGLTSGRFQSGSDSKVLALNHGFKMKMHYKGWIYLFPYTCLHSPCQWYRQVNGMNWLWGKEFSLGKVWWRAEKQDKTGIPKEQTIAHHGLPLWGIWEAIQLLRAPWRCLAKGGRHVTKDRKWISLYLLIYDFVNFQNT